MSTTLIRALSFFWESRGGRGITFRGRDMHIVNVVKARINGKNVKRSTNRLAPPVVSMGTLVACFTCGR